MVQIHFSTWLYKANDILAMEYAMRHRKIEVILYVNQPIVHPSSILSDCLICDIRGGESDVHISR